VTRHKPSQSIWRTAPSEKSRARPRAKGPRPAPAADLLAVLELGDDGDGAKRFGAMRAGDAVGLEALAAVAGWARTGGSGRKFRIDFGAGAAEVRRYCAKLEARMTLRLLRRCCPVLPAAWLGQSITSCERRMGCDCK